MPTLTVHRGQADAANRIPQSPGRELRNTEELDQLAKAEWRGSTSMRSKCFDFGLVPFAISDWRIEMLGCMMEDELAAGGATPAELTDQGALQHR